MSSRWTHVLLGLVATALMVTSLTFALTAPASSTDTAAEASEKFKTLIRSFVAELPHV